MLNDEPVIAKLDPGASHAFMSRAAAKKCNLKILPIADVEIELGDNSTIQPAGIIKADLNIDGYTVSQEILIIEMSSFYKELPFIIFGRKWPHKKTQ